MMYKKIPLNSEEYDENAQTIPLEKIYAMSAEASDDKRFVHSGPEPKCSSEAKPASSVSVNVDRKEEAVPAKKEEKSEWFNCAGDL